MYRLQLFSETDPSHPLEARLLHEGQLVVGRDPALDWCIDDPDCAVSRVHCEFHADDAGLALTPRGANGVFDDATGDRFRDGKPVVLTVPCTLRIGGFRMVASRVPQAVAGGTMDRTMVLTPPMGESTEIPVEWSDPSPIHYDSTGSLLEAFCQGAGFDSSALSAEDPVAIMRRAGAVYRQMVLGVSDLMQERDRARRRYELGRTTIGGVGNNYFKWAPSQRLAIDLLLSGKSTFLEGPDAVRSSFKDIKRHLIATFAGLQGSLRRAIDTFAPAEVAAAVADRTSVLRSHAALQVEELGRRHATLARELDEAQPGTLEAAFSSSYASAEAAADRADQTGSSN